MNVNMNAMSFYGKQGSELPGRHYRKGNLVSDTVPVAIKQTYSSGEEKLQLLLRAFPLSPLWRGPSAVKNSLPGKIPTESPGHMTCSVHMAHGKLSIGLPQGTDQKHVLWPRCSALFGLVSHRDACPRAETL